ncbi:DUF3179 domain-containing protein [Nocardioides panacisoli]|uniref:DUF3179 domain-containing protein n=1 Tax=Nocardioides panacisoli TaxID=627624 RepID=UPI001C626802|nr:DUF3179 domain-containing protein [Nocardioides panacisoli]QYJ05693.1 DUF3179 domain-containing protein [Nocardioides panacisoli]
MGVGDARGLLALAALFLSACGGATTERGVGHASGGPRLDVPSALVERTHPSFPDPLIDVVDLVAGGPPPDGIPPIDRPRFTSVGEVDWLAADDPVLALTIGAETRAYPLEVMVWHEIVNDVVGGTPVAVTYCPLCNSGVAFHREIDGRVLDFGTSGLLYVDNLVMYDRQSESLWPQLTGLASVGHLTGEQLERTPLGLTGWDQFRAAHPDSLVLNRDTGHDRDYGRNPYIGYDDPDGRLLAPVPGGTDDRLPVKERVVGLEGEGDVVTLRRSAVATAGAVNVEVGGTVLTVWHQPGQASALDAPEIVDGRDVGTVAVFEARLDGRPLTFSREAGGFVDARTGSRWNIRGHAVDGPLVGERLVEYPYLDTFWFAWIGFRPDATIEEIGVS